MDKSYRSLVREVAYSQYAVRDQNSLLGFLWSFLSPLLTMLVLFAYFHMNAGRDVHHYAIFLLLGMVQYTHFSNSTSGAMNVLPSMAQLTRHTIVPKEVLVIGSVLSNSVDFLISLPICVGLARITGIPLHAAVLWLPLIVVLQVIFVLWVSFLLAATRVFVKDLSHLYQVFLRLLFFITPIFYASDFLHSPVAQRLVRINPLANLLGMTRAAVIDGHAVRWLVFLALVAAHAMALCGAYFWFKRCEPSFAEYV